MITAKNFKVKFLGVKMVEKENYKSQMGFLKYIKIINISKHLNLKKECIMHNKQVTTEAAIHSTIFGDLYIAIGDVNTLKKTLGQQESGSTPSLFGFGLVYCF